MQRALRINLTGILMMLTMAVSMALLGFAHRAPAAQDQAIAVAALSGMDISDICAGTAGDLHGAADCPLCHIGGGSDLPQPVALSFDADLRVAQKIVLVRESRAPRMIRDPAHGLRAPPRA